MKKIVLFVFAFIIFFAFSVENIFGVSGDLNILLSPTPLNLKAKPGENVEAVINIKNLSNNEETLDVSLMKFVAADEKGSPSLLEIEENEDFGKWVTFDKNNFKLFADETTNLKVSIKIPENASLSYYYAVVFSRDSKENSQSVNAMAALVLLEVESEKTDRKIEVVDFSTDKKIYNSLPIKFNIKVKNSGNVHVAPKGDIFIDSKKKRDTAILSVNKVSGNVLPDSYRNFEVVWKDENKSRVNFGKMEANLLLVFNDGQLDSVVEAKVSFWVVPWKLLSLIAISLLILIVLKIFLIKNKK